MGSFGKASLGPEHDVWKWWGNKPGLCRKASQREALHCAKPHARTVLIVQRRARKYGNDGEGSPESSDLGGAVSLHAGDRGHPLRSPWISMESLHGFHEEAETEVTFTASFVTPQKGSWTKAVLGLWCEALWPEDGAYRVTLPPWTQRNEYIRRGDCKGDSRSLN